MVTIPNLEVICCDCVGYGEAICALRETMKHIKPAKVTFFTDIDIELEGIEVVKIDRIKSKREYSEWIMKSLAKYITCDYVMTVQGDGFVLDGEQWTFDFLKYDAIGAPWPYDSDRQVGNFGFCIKSKKLIDAVANDPLIDVLHPEDNSIAIVYKMYLEETHGIRFAPVELASKFSFELIEPTEPTLGFHGTHWEPYKEHVMITRRDSLGDVVACEPVLHYFYMKGYSVILNTLPQFQNLFFHHYYPIKLPHEVNSKIKFREINLNMAYESFPQMNHLDAYYQAAGVPKEERVMRNPMLSLDFNPTHPESKLFKKYACLHTDIRETEERNVYGLDWDRVAKYLSSQGYTVLHIGRGGAPDIKGTVRMNTPTEPFMKWVLGGADLFVGIDSGPANVSVAMGTPAVVFSGSVDLRLIYPDLTNVLWITNHFNEVKPCGEDQKWCWHRQPGSQGISCAINQNIPPCTVFDTDSTIQKIDDFIKEKIDGQNRKN